MSSQFYKSRGVSATKDDVHRAISSQDQGLLPGAFCKILPDPAGLSDWCMSFHADGAGTKSSVAYLMYRETGNPAWFAGLAQDAVVMNTDDLACVGAYDQFYLSNTIGRNAQRVDGDCLSAIIHGYDRIVEQFQEQGITLSMTGGETADVGDLVQTVICDASMFVRFPRCQLIDPSRIAPGMAIIGLASFGRMNGEVKENSGIGSNGLTAARHLLLHPDYRTRYPESYSSSMDPMLAYCGNWHLTDPLPGSELSVGEALLSPTRSFLPVIKTILKAMPLSIAALIHCTGGGQAKCRDFGHQIRYVKDNLFPAPPLFEALRETGQIDEKELYQVFNMGHRMELVCQPEEVDRIRSICGTFELETRVIGYTEANTSAFEGNEVIIKDRGQTHEYRSRGAAEPA